MSSQVLDQFPVINATLNGTSAALLLIAYVFIKRKAYRAHGVTMIAAVCTSAIFLACYLIYHSQRAPKSLGLPGHTVFRAVYFTILLSHTLLAIVILPLIAMTLWRAYKRRWDAHRKISVITLPLWFYVSVTGVVIYWMLYVHR